MEKITFKRVNSDVNGNPRYVCHYLHFVTEKDTDANFPEHVPYSSLYELALSRAKKIGGRKFHNKQYGGGIVFQSYNIQDTERQIHELLNDIKYQPVKKRA